MDKAKIELVKLCHALGIKLNETYAKQYKKDILKLWKYKDNSKAKKRKKIMKHLKVLLGRLVNPSCQLILYIKKLYRKQSLDRRFVF